MMMAVAGLGLLMNGGIMLALRQASRGDVNIRGAFIHMLGDALGPSPSSPAPWPSATPAGRRSDPILSILIALLIVWTAWDIIRESLNILLEGLPRGIGLKPTSQRHAGHRRRPGRPRSAHLEPGFELPRAELPRAD